MLSLILLLATKEGRYQFGKFVLYVDSRGYIRSEAVGALLKKVSLLSVIIGCQGDYGGCGRAEITTMLQRVSGTEAGYSTMFRPTGYAVMQIETVQLFALFGVLYR